MVAWAHLLTGLIHLHLASEAGMTESLSPARSNLNEAVHIGRDAGTQGHLAEGLWGLGILAQATGEPAKARSFLEEAQKVAAPLGWPSLLAKINAALTP